MSVFQTIATGDLKDVVLSNDGKTAYVSNTEGMVNAFDVATGDFVARWKVGTELGGMDLSSDGRYLVATEQTMTTAVTTFGYTGTLTVHVLDVSTGQVRDYKVDVTDSPQPFFDAVFTPDGKVLLSSGGQWRALWVLDPASGAFSTHSQQGYAEDGVFSATPDGSKIIFAPQNISDLPLYLYQSGNLIDRDKVSGDFSGYNQGFQAISRSGDLIIQQGLIYDGALKYKGALNTLQQEQLALGGATFSTDGSSLYVLDQSSAQILQLSTSDWSIQRAFASGLTKDRYASNLFNGSAYGDRLTISADGKYLVVLGDKALNVINLTTITASGGTDGNDVLAGDASANTIRGYGGNDVMDGGAGDDVLYGGHGDDRLIGGAGDDTLDGGAGSDTADYGTATGGVTVDLTSTYAQDTGGAGKDTLIGIENLTGGAFDDRLTGDALANRLDGGGGNDVLKGGLGSDTLIGGAGDDLLNGGVGDDVLDGGAGADIASYENAAGGVWIDLTKVGVIQNTRGEGFDTLSNIEGVRGSAFADVFRGGAADERFEGRGGDDVIDGGGGVDTAIYNSASANYAWTRNTNGTWTVRDLRATGGEGVDTLLNVEILQFTDRSVTLSASDISVTLEDVLPTKSAVTIASGQFADALLSADGRTAYISNSEGYISSFNVVTGDFLGRWKVGSQLAGMDLSSDGRYIAVAERDIENIVYEQYSYTSTVKIHLLDLLTGQVKDYGTRGNYAGGFHDVAFTSDNKVIFGQIWGGGGSSPPQTLDLATGAFTTSNVGSLYGTIIPTDDKGRTLFAVLGVSDAPLYIYTAGVGQTAFHGLYADGVQGYGNAVVAMAGNGNYVAQFSGGLYVYDGVLKFIGDLSKGRPELGSGIFGMDFSPDGHRLYVVDATTDRIFQFSTGATLGAWAIEQVYSLGVDVGLSPTGYYSTGYGNRVQVSADGKRMLISSDVSAVSVDLANFKPDGGTDYADKIVGTSGADRLQGFGGDDTISGGAGDDSLFGDGGDDVLDGGAGNDRLDGGSGSDWADYRLATGGVTVNLSLTSAQDTRGAGRDTLVSIENLFGSAYADTLTGDAGANIIGGGAGDDVIYGGAGGDTLWGNAGDDIIDGGSGDDIIDGHEGFDIASYASATSGVTVDLSKSGLQNTRGAGIDSLSNIEGLRGSAFADTLTGDAGANTLDGGAGDDTLFGGDGDDILIGGAGNDVIDGGAGTDTARYGGVMAEYSVVQNADGSLTVTDLRAGSPDGVDRLINIEKILFATAASKEELAAQMSNILRLPAAVSTQTALSQDLWAKWSAGTLTAEQVTKAIVDAADATTSVASMSFQFFTGKIPTALGFDYLISPMGSNSGNLNSELYAKFNTVNRYINFAMNLGKFGEAKDSFAAAYGGLTLFEATRKAYGVIFGGTPNDAKVAQLLEGRIDFLASFSGDPAEGIGTKAAMVGFLLAAAATENVGVIARSNDAWLTDLADGSAPFGVNLINPDLGYYKADFIYGA